MVAIKDKALEQPTSDDSVSRQAVLDLINADWKYEGLELPVNELPPVTPTLPKCTTNGEAIIRAFPNLKYTIQNGRVVTTIGVASSFDLDWWNAPYEMGGNKNE